MKNTHEFDFDPPHGKNVQGVIFDGTQISFWLESGQPVTVTGSVRFLSANIGDDEDIPVSIRGIFYGDYAVDDFIYPVEIHFEDTTGVIYERPRRIPECCFAIDVCSSFLMLEDPTGQEFPLIREPDTDWKPVEAKAVGRIGHLLFKY